MPRIQHPAFHDVKALCFDVFGTTVDWRTSVTRELSTRARARSANCNLTPSDWATLAQDWRTSYFAYTLQVARDPSTPVVSIDEHNHSALLSLLQDRGLSDLWSPGEIGEISEIWHRLEPWADSVEGLHALNGVFATATLSNGNVELLDDMAAYAGLPWTHVLSAEMFGTFKPNPRVYLGAAGRLGLRPEQCGMVAAHLGDLKAARECGFRTVYAEREGEEAWSADEVGRARREGGFVDVWIDMGGKREGFLGVADALFGV
ncbi:MAG: hypothetical protein M1828_003252 [Chrysothrix sp. TS-e1954]|nr:MAG: hypothetical protein M1828_003252 [Chrysothrix sp. TS-e1954]